MCMHTNQVHPYQKWSWHGDEIVLDPQIPAARRIPGTKKRRYAIDLRQFVGSRTNAVVQNEIDEIASKLSCEDQVLFRGRGCGSFEFRKQQVVEHMAKFRYQRGSRDWDDWRLPEETVAMGGGDCEDLAFLLYALLAASGISPYCLRVALGSVLRYAKVEKIHDHAWVMYKSESGAWELLEPFALCGGTPRAPRPRSRRGLVEKAMAMPEVEYTPFFVFNGEHVWRVRGPDPRASEQPSVYLRGRGFWPRFDPRFAVSVHEDIYDDALAGMAARHLRVIKSSSKWVDVNVLYYDPRDHFDFSYVDESWDRVHARLGSGLLSDFALAVHAIADFYAHTLYPDLAGAWRDKHTLRPWTPEFDASTARWDFSALDLPHWDGNHEAAAALWKGKIVSGQWWRWYTTFPDDLQERADFDDHFGVPDHDDLAVDSPKPAGPDHRYGTPGEWKRQFAARRTAAVEHIRAAYAAWSPRD